MDGYNWGTTQTKEEHGWDSQWRDFKEIFQSAYEELIAIAPHRPILVFETATVCQGGNKLNWIKGVFETLKGWNVRGVVWFQVKKRYDWRINIGVDPSLGTILRTNTSFPIYWIRGLGK